jgi:hypothetical protein
LPCVVAQAGQDSAFVFVMHMAMLRCSRIDPGTKLACCIGSYTRWRLIR